MPNNFLFPEKFTHHEMILFHPFRTKEELLSGFPKIYQNELQEGRVQNVVKMNKVKFESYGDS